MTALGQYLPAGQDFHVTWGSLNLVAMPTISLAGWMTLIFPILSIVTMVASQLIIQKTSGQELQGSMKYMPWIMSAMFIFIGFTVPVGFSLYYTVSNLLMAAVAMSVIPMIIIFVLMQKQLVKGIMLGGVKG